MSRPPDPDLWPFVLFGAGVALAFWLSFALQWLAERIGRQEDDSNA